MICDCPDNVFLPHPVKVGHHPVMGGYHPVMGGYDPVIVEGHYDGGSSLFRRVKN